MSEYEGVDEHGIPWVVVNGEVRRLACLPSPAETPKFGAWREFNAELPKSEWRECNYAFLDKRILNQKRTNGCVGWACAKGLRLSYAMNGASLLDFSPAFIYAQINGGRDQGSNLYQSLACLQEIGAALESEVPDAMIFKRQISQSAYETAKRFKIKAGARIRTFAEIASALTLGRICNGGIGVDNNFMNFVNSNGVIRRGGRIIGGHALTFCGLRKVNGVWVIDGVNSWGEDWGKRGEFSLGEEWFQGETDHWELQVPPLDPQDATMPPRPWVGSVA